jgi:hypothetical protein
MGWTVVRSATFAVHARGERAQQRGERGDGHAVAADKLARDAAEMAHQGGIKVRGVVARMREIARSNS